MGRAHTSASLHIVANIAADIAATVAVNIVANIAVTFIVSHSVRPPMATLPVASYLLCALCAELRVPLLCSLNYPWCGGLSVVCVGRRKVVRLSRTAFLHIRDLLPASSEGALDRVMLGRTWLGLSA